MRINDRNGLGAAATEAGRTQEVSTTDRADRSSFARTDSTSDRVEFSSNLGKLSQALSAMNAQRASRVQGLATQYQSGQYQPDALATSQSMVADALNMGQA